MAQNCHVFLYVIAARPDSGPVKIGLATNPARRMRGLQTGSPQRLGLHGTFKLVGPDARKTAYRLERDIHRRLAHAAVSGEWFAVTPAEARHLIRDMIGDSPVTDLQRHYARWATEIARINEALRRHTGRPARPTLLASLLDAYGYEPLCAAFRQAVQTKVNGRRRLRALIQDALSLAENAVIVSNMERAYRGGNLSR